MIEKVQPPQTLADKLRALKAPDDSFLIELAQRNTIRTIASREKVKIVTQVEKDGVRVWRKFTDLENVRRIEAEGLRLEGKL